MSPKYLVLSLLFLFNRAPSGLFASGAQRLLMSVIKGCLKDDSKELKKLVMMYWEVVKKYDAEGKLLPEMILVRTSTHPWFLRRFGLVLLVRSCGSALHRFLSGVFPALSLC